jgi:hypothetical protein
MKQPKRDPVRDDRIRNEAIVDARPKGQAMSWYYHLEGKIIPLLGTVCRGERRLAAPEE